MLKQILSFRNLQLLSTRRPTIFYPPVRFFSNFRPLEPETETTEKKYYRPYDPNRAEPDIDPEDFKRMQTSLHKFSQAMQLGKYNLAQVILDEHKGDIETNFPDDHPA